MTLNEALLEAGVDLEVTMRRFGGNAALLERFIKKLPEEPTFSALTAAVEKKSCPEIEKTAHTLKGIAANLGFQEMSDLCAALVSAVREDQTETLEEHYQALAEEHRRISGLIHQITE